MRISAVLTLLNLGLLITASASKADPISFNIISIDVPGSTSTNAIGIDNAGQIVGSYVSGGHTHGFIDTNGVFKTIDVPGSSSTQPTGINNAGQIVGFYNGSSVFLDNKGTFSTINIPAANFSSRFGIPQQVAINDAGQIVGTTSDARAFLYSNGKVTFIPPLFSLNPFNVANSVNDAGAIAGAAAQITVGATATVFLNGSYVFNSGGDEDTAYGINNAGDIVFNSGNKGGGIGLPATFLVKNGVLNPLPPFPVFPHGPDFFAGFARGLNDSDQIVGTYLGSAGDHGFLATPVPEPASFVLLAAGLAGLGFLRRRVVRSARFRRG